MKKTILFILVLVILVVSSTLITLVVFNASNEYSGEYICTMTYKDIDEETGKEHSSDFKIEIKIENDGRVSKFLQGHYSNYDNQEDMNADIESYKKFDITYKVEGNRLFVYDDMLKNKNDYTKDIIDLKTKDGYKCVKQ